MKRSKAKHSLKLNKKTLRNLSSKDLTVVVGGTFAPRPTQTCPGAR